MSITEQAKVVTHKTKEHAKAAWSHVVEFLKSLRAGTRNIPALTSPRAFGYMSIGLVIIVLALGAWIVAVKPEALIGIMELSGVSFGLAVIALIVFSIICAGYLTITANWDCYIIWWVERRAFKRDRKSPVTTSLRYSPQVFW